MKDGILEQSFFIYENQRLIGYMFINCMIIVKCNALNLNAYSLKNKIKSNQSFFVEFVHRTKNMFAVHSYIENGQ